MIRHSHDMVLQLMFMPFSIVNLNKMRFQALFCFGWDLLLYLFTFTFWGILLYIKFIVMFDTSKVQKPYSWQLIDRGEGTGPLSLG